MIPRLKMTRVCKHFGATRALDGVSFEVMPGEVHGLIGENGAGKSTLMKVLSGAHRLDRGSIELDGHPFKPEDPLHARLEGIAMIYQELNLAPDLTVEENILLGQEPVRFGWLNRKESRRRASAALTAIAHSDIPLHTPLSQLTIAEQQIVEIARAISGRHRVLIMDEPTSSLTQPDTERLFAVIEQLKHSGVSIIYISHFLEECQRICDRYTVLRDGKSVGTGDMKSAELGDLIHLMVGRAIRDIYPAQTHAVAEPVLHLKNVAGRKAPTDATLTLHRGEILGIAGLVGAGRTETLRAVFGLDLIHAGEVNLYGRETTKTTPAQRLSQGIGFLSENRKEEGLLLNRSLADNTTITRFGPITRLGFISNRKQNFETGKWIEKLKIKATSAAQPVSDLSGGNQQKIAIARLLHHQAEIFLLDEPTRGIDVGSKAHIYQLIGELAAEGCSIIFVSSYLPELLGVCDTIGVMCKGILTQVRPASEWTEHSIIAAAVGHTATAQSATG